MKTNPLYQFKLKQLNAITQQFFVKSYSREAIGKSTRLYPAEPDYTGQAEWYFVTVDKKVLS